MIPADASNHKPRPVWCVFVMALYPVGVFAATVLIVNFTLAARCFRNSGFFVGVAWHCGDI